VFLVNKGEFELTKSLINDMNKRTEEVAGILGFKYDHKNLINVKIGS
jgi:hypothetical protein